jgi:WhiB family redox-sensing transcriptional regulator
MTVIHLSSRHGAASAPASGVAGDWRDRRVCADENPDLFFPDMGEDSDDIGTIMSAFAQAQEAREMCGFCPVIEQCRELARSVGATSGVWAGVWLEEKQMREDDRLRREQEAEEERKRLAEVRQRSEYNQRVKLVLHGALNLALERGADVIMARLRGEEEHTIAAWAGVSIPVVRRALQILLPPEGDQRVDVTGMERALRSSMRIRVLVARGRSDKDIAKLLRTIPLVIEQARRIIAHRDTAARQYVELTA